VEGRRTKEPVANASSTQATNHNKAKSESEETKSLVWLTKCFGAGCGKSLARVLLKEAVVVLGCRFCVPRAVNTVFKAKNLRPFVIGCVSSKSCNLDTTVLSHSTVCCVQYASLQGRHLGVTPARRPLAHDGFALARTPHRRWSGGDSGKHSPRRRRLRRCQVISRIRLRPCRPSSLSWHIHCGPDRQPVRRGFSLATYI